MSNKTDRYNYGPVVKWLALLVIPFMAWVSRMAGGGWPKLPLGLDQWLYSLPYAALLAPLTGWYSVLGYLGAVGGKRTGHGTGISLKEPFKSDWKPEKLEYLVVWLKDKISVYAYKSLVLAVTGVGTVIVSCVLLALYGEILAALVLFISGAMKAPAYMIGWEIFPDGGDSRFDGSILDQLNEATEVGEFLTGLFGGIGVVLAAWIVYF